MTDTTTERQAPPIPEALHGQVCDLIRNLAAVGGDANGAWEALRDYCSPLKPNDALAGLAAALLVTFTECITHPVEPGEYAEMDFPYDPNEGANTHE